MDGRSRLVLSNVCNALAQKVLAASDALNAEGTYILVVSGLRNAEEQNALYAQGRTTPGHIVTNAKAGQSMHNYGLAVDVVPYLSGQSGQLNWTYNTEQFQKMVNVFKQQGLEWGGDWHGHLADFDHFQMPGFAPTPTQAMQASYGDGSNIQQWWPSETNV